MPTYLTIIIPVEIAPAHATQDATGAWNVRSLKDATLARKERGFAHRVAVVGVRWDGAHVELMA